MFEKEIALFEAKKGELRARSPQGGFVVIKDDEVLGLWQNRLDAIKEGIEKYGNVAFLVKNIQEGIGTPVISFTRPIKFRNATV